MSHEAPSKRGTVGRMSLAAAVPLAPGVVARLDALINQHAVTGEGYGAQSAGEVDTEVFAPTG